MPIRATRVYCDANVFLAYVNGEDGRAATVQALLEESRRQVVEVVTSVLSIAEVAYGAHEGSEGLTEDGENAIDQLWLPASPVTLVDVSEGITRAARTVIRQAKKLELGRIGSADAVHLATAQVFECQTIFTYENESYQQRWTQASGIATSEPTVTVPQLDFD